MEELEKEGWEIVNFGLGEFHTEFRVAVIVGLTYLMANLMATFKALFRKCGVCQGKQWKEKELEKKMNRKLMQGLARRFNIPLDGEDLVNFNILNESVSVNETTVSVE